MSLTSYRTAPPRVTEFSPRSDTGNSPRNDFAALSGRRGEPQSTGRAAYPCIRGCKDLEGGPARFERLLAVGLADLAATYSPVS